MLEGAKKQLLEVIPNMQQSGLLRLLQESFIYVRHLAFAQVHMHCDAILRSNTRVCFCEPAGSRTIRDTLAIKHVYLVS